MTGKEIREVAVSIEKITDRIYSIRGQNVMLDRDLAELYRVETKVLKQAVRRNIDRFPGDFMFELNDSEFRYWRSQFVTSNSDKMGLRYKPMVFTEQGVAMAAFKKTDSSINPVPEFPPPGITLNCDQF